MARKPSKYVERTELTRAESRVSLLERALQLTQIASPDATERIKFPGQPDRYQLDLYGAIQSHGGLVVVRFSYPGQLDSIRVCWLDEARADYQRQIGISSELTAFAVAYERLTGKRNQLVTVDAERRTA